MQNKYKIDQSQLIGDGVSASVYRGRCLVTNSVVAAKRICAAQATTSNSRFQSMLNHNAQSEIDALKSIGRHASIIQLLDSWTTEECTWILMEMADGGDLHEYLSQHPIRDPILTIKWIYGLISGIMHIHSHNYMHRDLKPSNLLLSRDMQLKIADFGMACSSSSPNLSPSVGCRGYRAPELLFGSTSYTCSIDLWSVGCIIAELYLQHTLIEQGTEIEQIVSIFAITGTPTDDSWPEWIQCPDYGKLIFDSCPAKDISQLIDGPLSVLKLLRSLLQLSPTKRHVTAGFPYDIANSL